VSAATILRRLGPHLREDGALPVLASCVDWGVRWAAGAPRAHGPASRSFAYEGRDVPYFWHRYNHTWLNERAIEIALAAEVLADPPARTLEVGNVTGHYLPGSHLVVDKYEKAAGVRNEDVVDLVLDEQMDLIVSISTLEHVGLDEADLDPEKARRGIERLAGLLAPGGKLWVTIPIGYNLALDQQLRGGLLPFTRHTALKRVSARNDWQQVELVEVWDTPYDRLLYTAHGLVVAELVREP
jgi:hypothetical protein